MTTTTLIDLTLSLDTAAYASGEVLAATQEIPGAVAFSGGAVALHSILVIDKDDQGQGFDLVFFDSDVALGPENGALTITDLDATKILGIVPIVAGDFMDLGGSRVASLKGVGLVLRAANGSKSVWVAAISRGTGTYTAVGILLRFGFI
jgi:hypothetical protein